MPPSPPQTLQSFFHFWFILLVTLQMLLPRPPLASLHRQKSNEFLSIGINLAWWGRQGRWSYLSQPTRRVHTNFSLPPFASSSSLMYHVCPHFSIKFGSRLITPLGIAIWNFAPVHYLTAIITCYTNYFIITKSKCICLHKKE